MTPITKWLVLGVATSAKRDTRVLPNKASARRYYSYLAPDIQRSVGPHVDRGFCRRQLLWAIIEPLEVQRPAWTRHDHFGNLIGCSSIDLDPWSGLGLEDLRKTAKAVASVNAQLRLPRDGDLIVAVHSLHAGLLTFFIRVIEFALHSKISSEFAKHSRKCRVNREPSNYRLTGMNSIHTSDAAAILSYTPECA